MVVPFEKEGISGKALNELIIERNVRAWAEIGFSSVYYILDQLEKKGYLISESERSSDPQKGAPKKLYSPTKKGKQKLKETVKEFLSRKRLSFKELNLALASSYLLTRRDLVRQLTSYKDRLKRRLVEVEDKYEQEKSNIMQIHVEAIFQHSFSFIKVEIEFIDRICRELLSSNS